jgi:hypothetical protein
MWHSSGKSLRANWRLTRIAEDIAMKKKFATKMIMAMRCVYQVLESA